MELVFFSQREKENLLVLDTIAIEVRDGLNDVVDKTLLRGCQLVEDNAAGEPDQRLIGIRKGTKAQK